MRADLAFRIVFGIGVAALGVAGWLVGGQNGVLVWVIGLVVLWGATRALNRAFGGFLLGDDREDLTPDWDPDQD